MIRRKRISKRLFRKFIEEGWAAIPDKFRNKVANVALLIEEEPNEEIRTEQQLSPDETLLGLYTGIPAAARGGEYGVGVVLPDTITIFRRPIEEAAQGDVSRAREIIIETVWHEFAHYFGLDERQVRQREKRFSNGRE